MSQINRKLATIFLIIAAVVVHQFSFLLAFAVLIVAVFIFRGFQMSDLRVNVQNSNRAQTLVSTLYSWTETAVTTIVRKCKRLAVSENRDPAQNLGSPKKSVIHHGYYPDADNAIQKKRSMYQGSSIIQGLRVGDAIPERPSSYSPVSISEWNKKSSSTSITTLNKTPQSLQRRGSEKESFSHRGSPWGYSLSPQQRSTPTDVRPVQAVAGPLIASSRLNSSRDSTFYVDANSPGFSSRLLKYHSEVATHQPQYARPGQLPLVHLNTSPQPTLTSRNSRKVRAPVRVRIAPPSYDVSESRLFSRADSQPSRDCQSKSVVDVLKEISRKRIHSDDGGNEPKRHHRSDSSSSSSSSSSPAMVNGVMTDQAPSGKRPREDDSPKLQKKTCKRTRNNEIYSSLSSSRILCVGTKRKAADNWSRCSTPAPIGKHLKKSPHITPPVVQEAAENVDSEQQLSLTEDQTSPQSQQTTEIRSQVAVSRSSISPSHQDIVNQPIPSTSRSEDHLTEEKSDKSIPPKSHHGRLFMKGLAKGAGNELENIKDVRRNGGTKPWKTHRTVDVDAITGEDIVRQDLDVGSRRLNSMFSVLQSSASTSQTSIKADTVDGPTPKSDPVKPLANVPEVKSDSQSVGMEEKTDETQANSQAEKAFTPTPITSELLPSNPKEDAVTTTVESVSLPAFGVVPEVAPNPPPQTTAKDTNSSAEPSLPSVNTSAPTNSTSSITSPDAPIAFSTPETNPVKVPVTSEPQPSPPLTTTSSVLNPSTSSVVSMGVFGSPATATFTVPQTAEKSSAVSSPTFRFGTSTAQTNVTSPLAQNPAGFSMLASGGLNSSGLTNTSQATSPFTMSASTPVTTTSSLDTGKPEPVTSTVPGGFSFGASPVVTSPSSSEFSVPKTTSSAITFGISNPMIAPTTTALSSIPSLPSTTTITSTNSNLFAPKPTFTFGSAVTTTSAPITTTTATSSGFNFQFGSSNQPTLSAPKPDEPAAGGFKFTFGANKESTDQPLTQQTPKPPPVFGESFAFRAAPSANTQPMTLGTPSTLTPTIGSPAAASPTGGFNFSANGNAATKPTFGFGAASTTSGAAPSLGAPISGAFNFGAKPAEPTTVAPATAAPSMGAQFQFGSSTPSMPATSPLQPQQQQQQSQPTANPFSVGNTAEKPSVLGGGFSFGSPPASNMPNLQSNVPSFGQPSVPTFGAPAVNPMQNPQPSNPSLFQFGSGGGTMTQPGISSGGFNFGGAPTTGVTSTGFNFNPTGPSATAPFQFGAAPLQAPAMFSIGSGSTAPRSRPRNRRQK